MNDNVVTAPNVSAATFDVSLRTGRKRSRRQLQDASEAPDGDVCNEVDCGEPVDEEDLLLCMSPGCNMKVCV